jgi:1,2-phenylacetyl-CoA epoxidase PaaB subunit
MQKFLYEKYEVSHRGRVFKGCVSVVAEDKHQALEQAQAKAGEGIILCPIYCPPSE